MNLNNLSLPYPVLGLSDDILPLLPKDAVRRDITKEKRAYNITIDLKFDNPEIKDLIEKGYAVYTCECQCQKTMLRRCQTSKEPHFQLSLSKKMVDERVEIGCFVTLLKPLKAYHNSGFNEDYGDATFDMEEGDMLVAFPPVPFNADLNYDKLQAAESLMKIKEDKGSTDDDIIKFNIAQNTIYIEMPTPLFNAYSDPRVKGAGPLMHSSIVMNALTYALMSISSEDQDDNRKWVRAIMYRLETEEGLDMKDLDDDNEIPALAQKLMGGPYKRMFNNIIKNHKQEQEE